MSAAPIHIVLSFTDWLNLFGPGAAWAMAIESLNCDCVSQWCSSTRKRCISDVVEIAPPIDSSDNSM